MKRTLMIKKKPNFVEYLTYLFGKYGIDFTTEESEKELAFIFNADDDKYGQIVSDAIVKFLKFEEISKFYKLTGEEDVKFYSYLGTVVSLDNEEEKDLIISHSLPDVLSLEGFYNFCLTDLQKVWISLAEVTKKLYEQCLCKEDVYALNVYFFSIENIGRRTIVVDDGLFYEDNSERIHIIDFIFDREKNLAFNLFLNRPDRIVIPDISGFSQEFLDFITGLGE